MSLRRTQNSPSIFSKPRHLTSDRRAMQVTGYKTMTDQARSDVTIVKFMGITTSMSYQKQQQRPTTVCGTPRTVPRGIYGHIQDFAQYLHKLDNNRLTLYHIEIISLSLVRGYCGGTRQAKYHHSTLTSVGRRQRNG